MLRTRIVIVVLALLVAGCGGGGDTTDTSDAAADVDTTAEAAPTTTATTTTSSDTTTTTIATTTTSIVTTTSTVTTTPATTSAPSTTLAPDASGNFCNNVNTLLVTNDQLLTQLYSGDTSNIADLLQKLPELAEAARQSAPPEMTDDFELIVTYIADELAATEDVDLSDAEAVVDAINVEMDEATTQAFAAMFTHAETSVATPAVSISKNPPSRPTVRCSTPASPLMPPGLTSTYRNPELVAASACPGSPSRDVGMPAVRWSFRPSPTPTWTRS
ncbi:MAG: hypothetical protein GEU79_16375 [Acidimicrobiia bacterium]|nr:hypothetical protein [Acidimicrobiia bacterium]